MIEIRSDLSFALNNVFFSDSNFAASSHILSPYLSHDFSLNDRHPTMLPRIAPAGLLLSLLPPSCTASLPPSTYNSSQFSMGELAPKFSISLGSEKGNITESSFDYFPLILFNYNNTDPFSKIMVKAGRNS